MLAVSPPRRCPRCGPSRYRSGTAAALAVMLLAGGCGGGHPSRPAGSPGPTSAPVDENLGRSVPVADPVYPRYGNPALDVLRYQLALTYTPAQRQLAGTATLRIRLVTPASTLRLDLAKPLAVDQTTVDGRAVRAEHTGDKLSVPAGRTLPADRTVTLVVRYHGVPKPVKMPSTRRDAPVIGFQTGAGGAFTMQEPYGAFTWYPVNDQPSDKALYDVSVTVPTGWVAVSNGRQTGHTSRAGQDTYRYRAAAPMSSYLATIAVGHYHQLTDTGPHGLPVTYWVRDDQPGATAVLRKVPAMLAFLEQRFGPFPFESIGVVLVDSNSGMETQTMVTMGAPAGQFSGDQAAGYQEEIEHELSHQWFGDEVGPRTWRDVWLNEGFAMYVQMLYAASVGHRSEQDTLDLWRQEDNRYRLAAGPPGRYDPNRFAEPNVYLCPALLLAAIRQRLGDDGRFSAMMRDWAQRHRYGSGDRQSFIAFVNTETGQDFTQLINSWLDSPTTPD